MKYKIEIRCDQEEDIIVLAKNETPLLAKIEGVLCEENEMLLGYSGDTVVRLDIGEILCFFVESGKVYAMNDEGKWQVKWRLYQLEDRFPQSFVKINQSCLIQQQKIRRFHTSIGGALVVEMKNGYRDYVSRRQLKEVKERLGLSNEQVF